MKSATSSFGAIALFVLTSPTWSNTFMNSSVSAQSINKPSVQFLLQVHEGQPETWSWTPLAVYRLVGPIAAGSQLSANDYALTVRLSSPSTAQKDTMQVVYDARIQRNGIQPPKASQEFIRKSVVPKLQEIRANKVCSDDFFAWDTAEGSFTKSNVHQVAYVYDYCKTKDNIALINGIAIFENKKLVGNIVLKPKDENTMWYGVYARYLTSLHDINRNGFDELVVLYGHYADKNLKDTVDLIDILEVTNDNVDVIGSKRVAIYRDDGHYTGSQITAMPGKLPMFYDQEFETEYQKGPWQWKKEGPQRQFEIEKNSGNRYLIIN